jgi:DNA-binding transcriptional LysR family regulator
MTLEDLRTFVLACEAGSLSALARRLGRTQSSVSQHIARLEAEFGAALLERKARGIEPSESGRILWELALQSLDAIEVARQRIHAAKHGESGSLTITTGGTTVRHFLKNVVVQFRQQHPKISVHFLPAHSTRRCFEILRLNRADLALVTTGELVRGIRERTVAQQQLFLLVAADDPLARRRFLRLKDLKHIRYLGLAEGTMHRGLLEQAMAAQGLELKPEIVFDDFDTASVFVELGLGQAIVPAVQAHNFVRSAAVRAIHIVDLPPIPIGWGFRDWKHLSTAAKDFVRLFDAELRKMNKVPGLQLSD